MLLVTDIGQTEADLAAGRLSCRCGGRLRLWGYAAARSLRGLDGQRLRLRPRRARCMSCGVTHVVLPGWCLPRHGDTSEVIGAALVAKAAGHGWRAIAAQLGRPAATVRRWLRRTHDRHCHWLYRQGVTHAATLHPDVLNHTELADTMLGQALTALAAATVAWRQRFPSRTVPAWTLVTVFTRGRLLGSPIPAD